MSRAKGIEDLLEFEKEMNKSTFQKAVGGLKDVITSIGKGMGLAVLTTILEPFMGLLELFTPILEIIGALFEALVGEILVQLMPLMKPIFDLLISLMPVFRAIGQAIGGFIKWLIGEGGLMWIFGKVGEFFKFLGDIIVNYFILMVLLPLKIAFEVLMWGIQQAVNVIKWVWEHILKPVFDGIAWVFQQIGNVFRGVINFIIDLINGIMKVLTLGFWGNIPHFAAGGIVTGPTIGLIGEAGPEAVIPLNSSNTNNLMGDNSEVVEELKRANDMQEEMLMLQRKQARNAGAKRRFG